MLLPLALDGSAKVAGPIYSPFSSSSAPGAIAVNRSSVGALTFLVWDIIITLNDEVTLIWPQEWSFMKCVYFFVRYIPMMVQIPMLLVGSELSPHFHFSPHDCYIWQVYQGIAAFFITMAIDWILILRVDALYGQRRAIRCVVGGLYVCEIVGMAVGLALALPGAKLDDICVVVAMPRALIICGISPIAFQTFLFSLTLYKFLQAIKDGWRNIPIVVLLMRDGTWAFFILLFLYVGEIGLYALANTAFTGILFGWLLSISSFCGYRILLNLKSFAETTDGTERQSTGIQFGTQNVQSNLDTY